MRLWLLLSLLGCSVAAEAQSDGQNIVGAREMMTAALPDDTQVAEALDCHPTVEAAHGRMTAAQAEAQRLRVGPHEWTVSSIASLRDVRNDGQYGEVEVTATRGIRWPGRAGLDRAAGQFGITAARNRAEDVQHQAALILNRLWWDYLLALSLVEVDQGSVANLQAARHAVERQVQLREASLLDLDLASAALGSAEAQLSGSIGALREARVRLASQFPEISVPATLPSLPVPALSEPEVARMAEQVIERSHEVAAAEADYQRLAMLRARARADRLPEPQLGVRLFRERGGEERGAGVVLSMPIGGAYRRAGADRAAAEASAALSDRQAVARSVDETAAADAAAVRGALAGWQGRALALDAHVAAAARIRRGYALGAINLAELLMAERQSGEAFRAAAEARVMALSAIARLMIDSHNLWIGGDEVHEAH